jgi:antitoxin (DNA-binding transcriptional repressor) of toxin-antitoxin stability system
MQVSMREFKSHLSSYVTQAQSGELIELTSHRKVVARLIGVPSIESAGISCLLRSGSATWQGGKPTGAAFKLQNGGKPVSALVLEDRG